MKWGLVITILLIGVAALGAGSVIAGPQAATDLFTGTATTGAGQPFPVDVNPTDVVVRNDGAIGLGYTYRANGSARGSVPGDFSYEEHGYLFFFNPLDPSTFAGSAFVSGVFTLDPRRPGPAIVIADTSPSTYANGVASAQVSDLPHGAMRGLSQVVDKKTGTLAGGGTLTFGFFTFTNQYGTFTGYATPDFREFAISITFAQ